MVACPRSRLTLSLQVRLWLFTIGFSLSFGALFAKIWQAYRVYTKPELKQKVPLIGMVVYAVMSLWVCMCSVHVVHCIPHYMCISCISESEKEQRGGTERERGRGGEGRVRRDGLSVSKQVICILFYFACTETTILELFPGAWCIDHFGHNLSLHLDFR